MRQVLDGNIVTFTKYYRSLNCVAELADIAWPMVVQEAVGRLIIKSGNGLTAIPVELFEKMIGNGQYVALSLPQRRQIYRININPVIKILAERSGIHHLFEIFIGGEN